MLNFDDHGNLIPDQPIFSDMGEVEAVFGFNEHRVLLLEDLKSLLNEITNQNLSVFEAWIDGSFATLKPIPHDIDVIFYIDDQYFDAFSGYFLDWKKQFSRSLDIYFVRVYPEHHPLKFRAESDRVYWLTQFTKDRKRYKKGLITIQF